MIWLVRITEQAPIARTSTRFGLRNIITAFEVEMTHSKGLAGDFG